MSRLLEDVVSELSRLPGIGKRTALRLAIHMLGMEQEDVSGMTEAIEKFKKEIKYCIRCNNLSDHETCPVCTDETRERSVVCVVEQVGDLMSIENTRQYHGLYHVLGGVISPMQGVGPSDLKVDLLLKHISEGVIKEVILAIGTTIEGETTQFYLLRRLEDYPHVKVSCIARGIGFGDEIEYADEITVAHAIHNRTNLK